MPIDDTNPKSPRPSSQSSADSPAAAESKSAGQNQDATLLPEQGGDAFATHIQATNSGTKHTDEGNAQDPFATEFGSSGQSAVPENVIRSSFGAEPEIQGYRILKKLGQGGMGSVFLAEDEHLSRQVAIKIVTQSFHESQTVRQRFEAEIRTLAALQHTYIAQLFSAGTYHGLPYFVMEFVDGPTLEQLAREPMKPRLAAGIISRLCEAVEYCHQQGILHRDLKPSNVLMQQSKIAKQHSTVQPAATSKGTLKQSRSNEQPAETIASTETNSAEASSTETNSAVSKSADSKVPKSSPATESSSFGIDGFLPKIADFGLAKVIDSEAAATRTGEILGTPGYMSPEQASGVAKKLTPACDVYALGAILYRLLTGRPPFAASEPLQAVMQVLSQEPVRPRTLVANIPPELETICLKCLEKTPARRYPSAAALFDDLRLYLEGMPISARPASIFERTFKWSKRHPAISVACVGAVAMTLAAIGAQFWHAQVLSAELARTRRLADHGSQLSLWLIQDHLVDLNSVAGTTSNRHDLVKRVQNYLDASLADMPPDSKYTKQLGYSYTRLAAVSGGDDQNNLGDLQAAEANYLKSLELYDLALAKGEPRGPVLRLRTGTLLSLAGVYYEMQDYSNSDLHLSLASEALSEIEINDWDDVFLKLQWLDQHIERFMVENDFETALQKIAEAQTLLESPTDDVNELEKKNQNIWLASNRSRCFEFLGRLEEANESYKRTVDLAKADLDNRPLDALAKRRYASILVQYADCLFSQEQVEESLEIYSQALQSTAELFRQDPASIELAADLALKYSRICNANRYLQNYEAADAAITKAIQIHEDLNAQGKARKTLQQSLATYLLSKADLCIATSRYDQADVFFDRHRELCKQLLAADPNSAVELTQLGEHHFQRAVMLVTRWFDNPIDPEGVRQSTAYKEIDSEFEASLGYFDKIAETQGLDYHQEQYRQRIKELRSVVESAVDDMLVPATDTTQTAEKVDIE